jgi:hypothetical protein
MQPPAKHQSGTCDLQQSRQLPPYKILALTQPQNMHHSHTLLLLLQVTWLDAASSTDSKGRQLHHKAGLQDGSVAEAGQAVQFSGRQLAAAVKASAAAAGGLPRRLVTLLAERPLTGLLQCMWETEAGGMMAQASAAN